MSQKDSALDQDWAVVLKMDLGQECSVNQVIWAGVIRWQVEDLFAPVTLVVRSRMCTKFFQQGWHNHWDPDAALWVHGFDMFAEHRRMMLTSAEQAVLSQQVRKDIISPQV